MLKEKAGRAPPGDPLSALRDLDSGPRPACTFAKLHYVPV